MAVTIWITSDFTVQYGTFTVHALPKGDPWPLPRIATLTFRIEPELKEALRVAAGNEHRSIANMIAVMVRDYCGGGEIQELPKPPVKAARKTTPRKR